MKMNILSVLYTKDLMSFVPEWFIYYYKKGTPTAVNWELALPKEHSMILEGSFNR